MLDNQVICTISFYNDAISRNVADTIASIKPYVDQVIAVDGNWLSGEISHSEEVAYLLSAGVDKIVQADARNEMDKRIFENTFSKAWTFILDTDEVLLYGGEWIRRAVAFGGDTKAYQVILMDMPTGLTAFRRNLFQPGAFEHWGLDMFRKDYVEYLPIIVGHKAMGTYKLQEQPDREQMKKAYLSAKLKGRPLPTAHRLHVNYKDNTLNKTTA